MNEILHMINNVGFPIVCCYFMFRQNQALSKSIEELNKTLTSIDRRIEVLEKGGLYNEQNK